MAIIDNRVYWRNKIGIIISPKGDKGFFTRGASEECIFDATLSKMVRDKEFGQAQEYITKTYPGTITENITDLELVWVHRDKEFSIIEVNGEERVIYKSQINWMKSK